MSGFKGEDSALSGQRGVMRQLRRLAAVVGAALLIGAAPVAAQEITGGECASAVASGINGQFDAGWFHNKPALTLKQDGYANPPAGQPDSNGNGWIERYWDDGQTGANTSVVAGTSPSEIRGSGLTAYNEGPTRTRYLLAGVGGTGTTLNDAINGNWYLEYQFRTPATLPAGTFFKKNHVLSYAQSNFKYAVRVFEQGTAGWWTVAQNAQINIPSGDSNTYQRFVSTNTRFPVLKPNTLYTLRLYLYDRRGSAIIAPNTSPGVPAGTPVIVADDFMFGTGVCPPPRVTVTKVSTGSVGSFNFTGTNGFTDQTITTTTAGTAVSGATRTLTAGNTQTILTEAPPAGFRLASVTCSGLSVNGTATPSIPANGAGGSVTLDAAAVGWGNTGIACTFTNASSQANLSISKTNSVTSTTAGTQTTYTLQVVNNGPAAADGAIVRDTPGTGLSACSVTSCSGSAGAVCPTPLANVLSATGAAVPTLPSGSTLTFSVLCTVN